MSRPCLEGSNILVALFTLITKAWNLQKRLFDFTFLPSLILQPFKINIKKF